MSREVNNFATSILIVSYKKTISIDRYRKREKMIKSTRSKEFCDFIGYMKDEVAPNKEYYKKIQINEDNSMLITTKKFTYLVSHISSDNAYYWAISLPILDKFILLSNIDNSFEKIVKLIDNHEKEVKEEKGMFGFL